MKKLSQEEVGIKYGFRSGSEVAIANQFVKLGIDYKYESQKLKWVLPEQKKTYTPDFFLTKANGELMIIECKGRWTTADRIKHQHIKQQYPDLDIRFVFDNPNARISKTSKTTYAKYCEQHGFRYSPLKKEVPLDWIQELKEV